MAQHFASNGTYRVRGQAARRRRSLSSTSGAGESYRRPQGGVAGHVRTRKGAVSGRAQLLGAENAQEDRRGLF